MCVDTHEAMLDEYVVETMKREGYTVNDVPFFKENIFVAYKDLSFSLSKTLRPFKLQFCFFLNQAEVGGVWEFSQEREIVLPPFRLISPVRSGLMKAITGTLTRAVRGVLTEIPVATTIHGDPSRIWEEAQNVTRASEIIPEETEHLDLYVEVPVVVTTAQLVLRPKGGDARTVGAVVLNYRDGKTGRVTPVIVLNYQHLTSLMSAIGTELGKRLVA